VEAAIRSYPSVRVSREQVKAAAAGIQLARNAYLPRIDTVAQMNRGTRNNVFGILLPQTVIPSLSGPVIGTNNLGTAWGSAVGALVIWEPFDFGQRSATVGVANAARAQADAGVQRSEFEVAVNAADAFLTLAAAQQTVVAARGGVERSEAVARTIAALVNADLRPGADLSRAQAETAAARSQLIQAEQVVAVARATLAQFMGVAPGDITISLPGSPPDQPPPAADFAANPIVREQNVAVEYAQAQLRVLQRLYFPRFYLQGSAYARGTGAEITGHNLGGLNGLAPNVQNYTLGFTVTFPVMDYAALRAREAGQAATIRAQTARSQQIVVELRARWNIAVANLEGARRIAANTPIAVSAARATLEQATARYQSGLGNINDVAEAQRLLTQAEIDDSLARLAIWRGLLGIAAATGDVRPFLVEASR